MSHSKRRIQLDMSPKAANRLDEMVRETDAGSRAEVVRKALALYDRVLYGKASGERCIMESETARVELVIS